MSIKIHFISGLPRSGSTLLSAILRQNPEFTAGMSSPLAQVVSNLIRSMSPENPLAFKVGDDQRARVIRASIEAFYEGTNAAVIFDTNRGWNVLLGTVARVFPEA